MGLSEFTGTGINSEFAVKSRIRRWEETGDPGGNPGRHGEMCMSAETVIGAYDCCPSLNT